MKSLNVWELSRRLENLLLSGPLNSSQAKYLSLIRTEYVEIVAQLHGPVPLVGYKLVSLKLAVKARRIAFRMIKNARNEIRKLFSHSGPIRIYELAFIVEHGSHYFQYRSLRKELLSKEINHSVLFINDNLFRKYGSLSDDYYNLSKHATPRTRLISLFESAKLNFQILFWRFDHVEHSFNLKLELLYYNSKNVLDTRIQCNVLKNCLMDNYSKVVLFKGEGFKARSLIQEARNCKATTVAIQHGLIAKDVKFSRLNVEHYFVWSHKFKDVLASCDSGANIMVMGCPGYDRLSLVKSEASTIPEHDKFHLLFLPNSGKSQTPLREVIFALERCLELARIYPKACITIKPHPGGDVQVIRDLLGKYEVSNVNLLDKDSELNLASCDIVATMNSTVGIESAVFKKPLLIVLSDPSLLMVEDYLVYRIGEYVDSDKKMRESVVRILDNYQMYQRNCERFSSDFLVNIGESCEKIVEELSPS